MYFINPKTSFLCASVSCSLILYLHTHTFVPPTLTFCFPLLPRSVSPVKNWPLWTVSVSQSAAAMLWGRADLSQSPQQPVQRLHVLRLLLQQLVAEAGDVLLDLLQLAWGKTGTGPRDGKDTRLISVPAWGKNSLVVSPGPPHLRLSRRSLCLFGLWLCSALWVASWSSASGSWKQKGWNSHKMSNN